MSFTPENALVWCEIPVTDLKKSMVFYEAVFDYKIKLDESMPEPFAFLITTDTPGAAGHLYVGKPSSDGSGPTVHLVVPGTVEEAAVRCRKAGGTVLGDVITIPPGRFQYIQDIDGNSIGLFELAA